MMKRAIAIMGMPGSGKSTVGRLVASRLGWHYVSTGELARRFIDGEWSALGLMAPESEMRRIFKEAVSDYDAVVIDGMPRKPDQVDFLDSIFDEVCYYVLSLDEQTARNRLYSRGRSDDTKVAIERRLSDYKRYTAKAIKTAMSTHGVTIIDVTDKAPWEIADIISLRVAGGK